MTHEHLTTKVEELEELLKTGNRYAQAEKLANVLRTEFIAELQPELHCRILLVLSESYVQRELSSEALGAAEQSLSIALQIERKPLVAQAYRLLGVASRQLSDYPQALEYLQNALANCEELDDKGSIALISANLGNVYWQLSDLPHALAYHRRALALDEERDNKTGMARDLGNIGLIYADLADYSSALEYYGRALELCEELGNDSGVARNSGNIGLIYRRFSNYQRALEYFEKALAIDERLGNTNAVARQYSSIALVYRDLDDYPRTLEYFHKSLALHEVHKDKRSIALNANSVGNLYDKLSDFPRALEYYHKSLQLFQELGITKGVADSIGNIGCIYAREGFDGYNPSTAEEHMLKSLSMYEDLNVKEAQSELHRELSKLYEQEKSWEEFALHYKRYHLLEKEVNKEESKRKAEIIEQQKQMTSERAAAEATTTLLHRVLPSSVADRLIKGEKVADYFEKVSILFADIVGFTPIAALMQARDVLSLLNYVFGEFDRIMEKHGCQKIKTMGDGYMAVCGAPVACDDHAERLANAALDLLNDIELPESLRSSLPKGSVFHLRIGLHCGPAFAGIVGEKGFVYDVYSDAVNLASRMESHGEPGRIHCSVDFKNHLGPRLHTLRFAERGEIEVKGKGKMRTYFLEKA